MEKNSDALTTALNKLKEDLYNNVDKKYENKKNDLNKVKNNEYLTHNLQDNWVNNEPTISEIETIKPQRNWYDLFDPLDPEVEEEEISKTR